MLSKEQAELKAEQLIQKDSNQNLQKIAKLNSFQLWLFKNKLSKSVSLEQQFLLLKVAKQHADQFQLDWKAQIIFIAIIAVVLFTFIFSAKPLSNSNYYWFSIVLFPMFLPAFIRYVKVKAMYKALLLTHLEIDVNK